MAPDVRTLRELAPRLSASLTALDGLTPEFGAFFEELRPVMRAADRGLPAATAIFKATEPLFGVVYPASRELGPIFSYFNAYATDTVSTFAKAGAATAATHEGRHYLRTLLPITSENLVGADAPVAHQPLQPLPAPGRPARLPRRRPARVRLREHVEPGDAAADRERARLPRGRPVDLPRRHARSFPHVERDAP